VIRFDSLSKVLGGGLRIGYATGPAAFIRQLELHVQATLLQPSAVSQAMVAKLLATWQLDGWERHLHRIILFYARKRDAIVRAAEKHLSGLAKWTVPDAGNSKHNMRFREATLKWWFHVILCRFMFPPSYSCITRSLW
jgi:DNA-binding transcriptional MocR family regulator